MSLVSDLMATEAGVRLGCVVGAFAVMTACELSAPRRALSAGKPLHWGSNLGLVFLNRFLLRFIAPLEARPKARKTDLLAGRAGWANVLRRHR